MAPQLLKLLAGYIPNLPNLERILVTYDSMFDESSALLKQLGYDKFAPSLSFATVGMSTKQTNLFTNF